MIDIDKIEEAAKRHGNDADWQGAAIAYETHVTPSVVLEMVNLIRLQEAGLSAEQARYESLSEAFALIPAQAGMPVQQPAPVDNQENPQSATYPDHIWLQSGEPSNEEVLPYTDGLELTWCPDRQNHTDVRYVRADLAEESKRRAEKLAADWGVTQIEIAELRRKLNAAPVAAPVAGQEPTLLAYAATDLDGRVDVGLTPEKAKERAGNGCDTVFGLYDLGDAVPAASVQPAPYGYVVRANDGHETYFKDEPTGFKAENWHGLVEIIPLYGAAPKWDESATQRLRSIVDALGLQSCVPNGDLTSHEFAVLGFVRREVEKLKAAHPANGAQPVSDAALLSAIRNGVPLEEPVSVAKAMMAQEKASVCLEKSVGPLAMVQLVNIQVQPWTHTKETATAYADGFNRGVDWLRSSIIQYADKLPSANLAQVGELSASPDSVVETNVALMRQRSAVGVEKYGTTLADSGLPVRALLVHALEESLDMANYIQAVIHQTDAMSAPAKTDKGQG